MTHVTLTGDEQLAGDYVVRDQQDDGTVVLQRESEAAAIIRRTGGQAATPEQIDAWFAEHGGQMLPADGEG